MLGETASVSSPERRFLAPVAELTQRTALTARGEARAQASRARLVEVGRFAPTEGRNFAAGRPPSGRLGTFGEGAY
jgi:hypothetical protein